MHISLILYNFGVLVFVVLFLLLGWVLGGSVWLGAGPHGKVSDGGI